MNTPTVNLSELGANLSEMIEKIDKTPLSIIKNKKVIAYILSSATYEKIMDELEDVHLNTLVKKRLIGRRIHVNLRDL